MGPELHLGSGVQRGLDGLCILDVVKIVFFSHHAPPGTGIDDFARGEPEEVVIFPDLLLHIPVVLAE